MEVKGLEPYTEDTRWVHTDGPRQILNYDKDIRTFERRPYDHCLRCGDWRVTQKRYIVHRRRFEILFPFTSDLTDQQHDERRTAETHPYISIFDRVECRHCHVIHVDTHELDPRFVGHGPDLFETKHEILGTDDAVTLNLDEEDDE